MKIRFTIGLIIIGLNSCVFGPNFKHPLPPPVSKYTSQPVPKSTVASPVKMGERQYFRSGQAIAREWWKVFHSKDLNDLIDQALCNNPDVLAAAATLRIAHENMLTQKAFYFPQLTANFSPLYRQEAATLQSDLTSGAYVYALYLRSLQLSYAPDILGLNFRRVEGLKATEEMTNFQREAVHLTLASNVALTAISEASIRVQLKATQRNIKVASNLYKMMAKQYELGQVGKDAVAAQKAFLARTKADLPFLEKALIDHEHQLAVLVGHIPGSQKYPQFTLDSFVLPRELPVSLPSKLVQQRPDIRAAEAQLHANSAAIGVAIANRLPSTVITATGGFIPVDFDSGSIPLGMISPILSGTGFWSVAANFVGVVFDAGALRHQHKASIAAYEVAQAQYRRVVLDAFKEVANTLNAIQKDAEALKIAKEYVDSAKYSFYIARKKWELNATNHIEVLNAEYAYRQSLLALGRAQADRLSDSVALFQALGGGWT